MRRPVASAALAAVLLVVVGCSRNPVLGEWELDTGETDAGTVLAVQAAKMEKLSFTRGSVSDGEVTIDGDYIVEEGRVRFVRGDGNGEHVIELLDDDRIDVELPIGVHAIYKRAG
jgi:hypothetical protein